MSENKEVKWAYSLDEESFHGGFATKDEAKAEAMARIRSRGGDPSTDAFWVGECSLPSHEDLAFGIGEYVEDNLACAAHDIWDDAEYPGPIAKDIQALIEDYLNKNVQKPEFYTVTDVVGSMPVMKDAEPRFTVFQR